MKKKIVPIRIKPCLCESIKIVPLHLIKDDVFYLWLECTECKTTGYSCQTLLTAIESWNRKIGEYYG